LVRESLCQNGVTGELIGISDGDSAIRFIESLDTHPEGCPDLVILDLNLPKYNGLEVLKVMRKSVRCRNVPVVILSSSDLPEDKDKSLRLGANRYIHKPYRLDEFLALGAIFRSLMPDAA
jgi:DNA-binding response OmpR family regulator